MTEPIPETGSRVDPGSGETVSVIIPTRNRASYLSGAVTSALAQSYANVEVVVVDDGSDDETPQILSEMSAKEPRLRVFRHDRSGGAPRARNAGVRHSRGSIIAFLDDDCLFAPDKIEKQLPLLSPERGVVYCQQVIQQVEGGWVVEGDEGANTLPLEGLLRIGTNTLLLRREHFEAVGGFDEELPRLQDWELLLRLARRTAFAYVPEILVKGVMVGGGITLTPGPLAKAAERIVAGHSPHLDARGQSHLHYILGKFLLVDGLTPEGKRFMATALRLNPLSLRNWAGLGVSLLGPSPARMVRGWRRKRRTVVAEDPWVEPQPSPAPGPGRDG